MRSRLAALAGALLLCSLMPASAQAAAWLAPELVSATTGAAGGAADADIGPEGDAVAVYRAAGGLVLRERPAGGPWGPEQPLALGAATAPSLVNVEVGRDGRAVVVFRDDPSGSSTGQHFAAYRDPLGSWGPTVPIEPGGNRRGVRVAVALDDAGNVTAAWRTQDELRVNARSVITGSWGTYEVLDPTMTSADEVAMDVDAAGNATVAYVDYEEVANGNYWSDSVQSFRRSGPLGAWGPKTKVSDGLLDPEDTQGATNIMGTHTPVYAVNSVRIDVAADGRAVVGWFSWPTNADRRVGAAMRESADGPWVADAPLSTTNHTTTGEFAVAIDGLGTASVLWWDANSDETGLARRAPGAETWLRTTPTTNETSPGGTPWSLTLAAAPDGTLVGGWAGDDENDDGRSRVRFVSWSPSGGWQSGTRFTAPPNYSDIRTVSASIDASGNGLLSWQNSDAAAFGSTDWRMRAAGFDGGAPEITDVDVPEGATESDPDGEAGTEYDFSAAVSDTWSPAGTTLTWDFGDGSDDATGASVTHTYADAGAYTVTITAEDTAGNTAQVVRELEIGPNLAPDVEITSQAYTLESTDDVAFTWTVDDPDATVTCELVRSGGGAGGHPSAPCAGLSRTYTDLPDGDYTFTVTATDPQDAALSSDDSDSFTIDTTPPGTTISDGPGNGDRLQDRTPSFTFASSGEADPDFECRIDSDAEADFDPCDDDFTIPAPLGDGEHWLDVRAVDAAGNADATPERRTFVVDNVPPEASATAPAGPTNADRPAFTYAVTGTEAGEDHATTCGLAKQGDARTLSPCTGGTYTPASDLPSDGTWVFEVVVTDEAGNQDSATAQVVVDRAAPTTLQIDGGPSGTTAQRRPTFTFSAEGETSPRFRCAITPPAATPEACDDGTFQPAGDLADGAYTFTVTALDQAGNESAPQTRQFTVDAVAPDTTAPDTRIDSGPAAGSSIEQRRPTFSFSAVGEVADRFECRLRRPADTAADWEACTSPLQPESALALGTWRFEVRAADAAGNVDQTPAARQFTVVEPGPETPSGGAPAAPPSGGGTPAAPHPGAAPPGFVPQADAIRTARMPDVSPKQSGGRWTWRNIERAREILGRLGIPIEVEAIPAGADRIAPRSLRDQLRRDDDAPGAVTFQDPPAGQLLSGAPGVPAKVRLAVLDPSKDSELKDDVADALDAAERRRRRRGRKIPQCEYLMLGEADLALAFAGTPDEARSKLRAAKCDFEVRYRKAAVANPTIREVRRDTKEGVIELDVWVPIVSDFVVTLREDPSGMDADDLTFSASKTDGGRQEWTLTADRDQDNVFLAQVQEAKTGRFVVGAKVELWAPGAEKAADLGTTNADGEVEVRAKLGTPGTHGLFVKVRDKDGQGMDGYRDVRVVQRDEASFVTPTNRRMRRKNGRWRADEDQKSDVTLAEARKLPLVPGNLGIGLAGSTTKTAEVVMGQAEMHLETAAGPGVVRKESPMLDLTHGSVVVAAGKGLILPSTDAMQVRDGAVKPATTAKGSPVSTPDTLGPTARAAQLEQWTLGYLVGAIIHRFISQPRAASAKTKAAVSTPLPIRIPILDDLVDRLTAAPVADASTGQVVDVTGATVLPEHTNDKALTVRLRDGRLAVLAVSQVISTGGGNVISTGGGNLTFKLTDGTTVGVISTGGGNVISTGGGNVISTGGGNVIATGGGNVISVGGGNVIATGGGNVISTGGGNVISVGGGNLRLPIGNGVISVGGGNVISTGGGNVISTGGGNVISTGGGNVISTGGLN